MKKTLSVLLSLLMVLSCVTCLFTMPASAEEATTEVATETAVETLPVNDYITNNGEKTITPDTVWKYNDTCSFPMATNFNIRGWNAKYQTDEEGNEVLDEDGNKIIISGQTDSYIEKNTIHQFTFDVTVSEDANEGSKLYIDLYSQNYPQATTSLVGVRSDSTTPNKVETAYNYISNTNQGAAGTVNNTASNAITLEAGKTYTYTYLFSANSTYVSAIGVFVDSLTAGSVTISDAKVFPASDTDAGNFLLKKGVIPYAVEEDGNVFTRMYGYRDVGSTETKKYTVSAVVGGDYYNVKFEGGKTYQLSFDARYTSDKGFHDNDSTGRSPAFDFFETGALDYSEEYNAIKNAADTNSYVLEADKTTSQREFSGPNNGYSYWWSNSGSSTRIRRPASNIAYVAYYTADGTTLGNKTQGNGSQAGRNYTNEINTGTWIKGTYTLDAPNAMTLQETAETASNYAANMRYSYVDGKWVYTSDKNNLYVPSEQNVTVALGMEFLYGGQVYDFDNFALKTDITEVPVEYKNANGETDTLANTAHTATMAYDVLANKTVASVNLFESDTLTFDGWYNGDTLVSTDAEMNIDGAYDDLKAVFTSKNILANAGGFENYTTSVSLESAYTVVKKATEPYPNYTGGEFRYYNSVPPTGDKWTGWDTNIKSTKLSDSDSGVTTAQIIADIEATGGIMNESGYTGFTYFTNFPKIVSYATPTIYSDAGNNSSNASTVKVTPYSGIRMLQMQASARTGYRAIEGLTPGKGYTLSMYVYNPYAYYFLKDVAIVSHPSYGMGDADKGVKQLAGYTTPHDTVTEKYLQADGTEVSKSLKKVKADYIQQWYKVELTFVAEAETAYLAVYNQNQGNTSGYTYIDELTLVEYQCNGNHIYDDLEDTICNLCGQTREYVTEWNFEDESLENITQNASDTLEFVGAVDQPEKIGDKYLQYTTEGWGGIAFNFMYEQGYKYIISYDFKIFTYGTGGTANGIDHNLSKYDNGMYGVQSGGAYANATEAALNPAEDNLIIRYWENGQAYQKVTCFSHGGMGENNFVGRNSQDGVYIDSMGSNHGGAIWDEWQRTVIEVGTNNDYEGLVEYGIRPNDAGWVVGIDNFKVERIATATIDEANNATNGTYAFNIRARTADKKQGLRFKSTIDLDSLNLTEGAKIVEYGTLAMKADLAQQGYYLNREAAKDMAQEGCVVAGIAYNAEDGTDVRYALDEANNVLTYTGVLTGIGVKNYDVDFMVRGYAIIEDANGVRTTVYDAAQTLSVYDAALQIVEENSNADDVAVAQSVIDAYDAYVASTAE